MVGLMKGGIQPGTTAWTEESKLLDASLRDIAKLLVEEYPQLKVVFRHSHDLKVKLVGEDCFGFAPDGGAWYTEDDTLLAVFEAKHQQNGGNAQERWWDNACTARHINDEVRYHTFCSGLGCTQGAPLERLSRKARLMLGEGYTFSLSQGGHTTADIAHQMRTILDETLSSNNLL